MSQTGAVDFYHLNVALGLWSSGSWWFPLQVQLGLAAAPCQAAPLGAVMPVEAW